MRFICRRAFVVLVLLGCRSAFAAPYPTVEQLRAAIGVAAGLLKTEGLALEMQDARASGVTLPLMAAGLDLTSGVCQVFYNPRPEGGLKRFFDGIQEQDLPVWLGAIAVHEATHCIEQREVYVRRHFDKVLPPDFKRDGMTVQGYLGVVKSGAVETWGEALADISSLLYLKQAAPDRWLHLARRISAMRRELAQRWPQHDTSAWLDRLIDANPEIGEGANLFDAAFKYRKQFRPG